MSVWRACLTAAVMVFAALGSEARAQNNELYIRVVDVGNGLCVVLHTPDGRTMLYDAGHFNGSRCLPGIDEVVGPNTPLDLVILSHSDADHVGELDKILATHPAEYLIYTGRPGTSQTVWPRALTAIEAMATSRPSAVHDLSTRPLPNVIDPPPGAKRSEPWRIPLGAASVTLVAGWRNWPYDAQGMDSGELNNVVSLVVRVDYGGKSVLLTGDTVGRIGTPEEAADSCLGSEQWMTVNAAAELPSTILIGQHHGGDNSSSACFIDAVRPSYVVFSAGHENYRHPRLSAVQRYTSRGAGAHHVPTENIFQTDRGDDQGPLEWSPARIAGCTDKRGDDDIEILLSADPSMPPTVRYRLPTAPSC